MGTTVIVINTRQQLNFIGMHRTCLSSISWVSKWSQFRCFWMNKSGSAMPVLARINAHAWRVCVDEKSITYQIRHALAKKCARARKWQKGADETPASRRTRSLETHRLTGWLTSSHPSVPPPSPPFTPPPSRSCPSIALALCRLVDPPSSVDIEKFNWQVCKKMRGETNTFHEGATQKLVSSALNCPCSAGTTSSSRPL